MAKGKKALTPEELDKMSPEERAEYEAEQRAIEEEKSEKAFKKGEAIRYECVTDCYWNGTRWRPSAGGGQGDVAEFNGAPPKDFPAHHFERL